MSTPAARGVTFSVGQLSVALAIPSDQAEPYAASASAGLVPLLEALAASGFTDMPDFAIVDRSGVSVRVLLRGTGQVVGPDGDLRADGRSPWRDLDLDMVPDVGRDADLHPRIVIPPVWPRPLRIDRPDEASVADASVDDVVVDSAAEDDSGADLPRESEVLAGAAVSGAVDLPPPSASPPPLAPEPPVAPQAPAPPKAATSVIPPLPAGIPPIPSPPAPNSQAPRQSRLPWRRGSSGSTAPIASGIPVEQAATDHTGPSGGAELLAAGVLPWTRHADLSGPAASDSAPVAVGEPPEVSAVECPDGHLSPPGSATCRTCDQAITTTGTRLVPQPRLGHLRVSTGDLVPLDRSILLGRSPQVAADVHPVDRPHVVRLGSVTKDISRQHAQVDVHGWDVTVRDLGSTNGTTITMPGEESLRLWPGQDYPLRPGTVLTLADEVSLVYEATE